KAPSDPASGYDHRRPLQIFAFLVIGWRLVAELLRHQLDQCLTHQARLARAGDAGDGGENAQRKGDIEVVQVVASDTAQPQPAPGRTRGSQPNRWFGKQVAPGSGLFDLGQTLRGSAIEDMAP